MHLSSGGKCLIPTSRSKPVKRPQILSFIMPEHVVIAVMRSHAKVCRLRRIPLVIDFCDIELSAAESKP